MDIVSIVKSQYSLNILQKIIFNYNQRILVDMILENLTTEHLGQSFHNKEEISQSYNSLKHNPISEMNRRILDFFNFT
jgi:hypothetical protein